MEELTNISNVEDISMVKEILLAWGESLLKSLPMLASKIIVVLLCFFIGRKVIDLVILSIRKIMDSRRAEPLLESFLLSLLKNLLYVILFFFVIGILGVRATSLVAILGSAGIAVGLALQGSLSNLAGGVLILLFRPFSKGDYISNDLGAEGTVDQIQIFNSILVTVDNKVMIVPNGQLANSTIVNFSKNPTRRLDLQYSVSHDSDVDKVIELLTEISEKNPKILKDQPKVIRLRTYNVSSMDFLFRVWVKSGDYWEVLFDCNEDVKRIFDKNGIGMPYQKVGVSQK
jgi:Small-conductance mechanosensitive channel